MAVRSHNIGNNDDKPGAFVSGEALDRMQGPFERFLLGVLLLLSFVGSVVAFNGGWPNVLTGNVTTAGIAGGILFQAACTAVQWIYRKRPFNALRVLGLLGDTTTTALGFRDILLPPLMGAIAWLFARFGLEAWALSAVFGMLALGSYTLLIAHAIIVALAVFNAWLPEYRGIR